LPQVGVNVSQPSEEQTSWHYPTTLNPRPDWFDQGYPDSQRGDRTCPCITNGLRQCIHGYAKVCG
jgi:hypothetical protein